MPHSREFREMPPWYARYGTSTSAMMWGSEEWSVSQRWYTETLTLRTPRSKGQTNQFPPLRGAKTSRPLPKRHTAFIRVQDTEANSEADTQKILQNTIDPARDKIQFESVRKMRSGAVAIDLASEQDLQSLLASEKLKNSGLVIEQPSKKSPKVIVYDVHDTYTTEQFLETLFEQNSNMYTGLVKNDVARGIIVRLNNKDVKQGSQAHLDKTPKRQVTGYLRYRQT
ncbi:hypothetical protein QAD02_010462 [Eretmocerus hayati]|uniref:Uncharacterized protein n=1 Tax=Eretmocerus hayati TaxID=131215 RepID=A0ACC2NU38_9HYME|nr:hypothetical protein QAD02_010462 [Eretmocerus hayati]